MKEKSAPKLGFFDRRVLIALISCLDCVFLAPAGLGQDQATPTPTPLPIPVAWVSLPVTVTDLSTANFTQSIVTSTINAADALLGFQGDFTFDSAIVGFQTPQVQAAGLTATNWSVASAIFDTGPGTTKTLRVSAFATGTNVLSGSGTLFQLNMTRISGTPGEMSPLVWKAAPSNFIFIDFGLNSRPPGSTPPGSITVVALANNISGNIAYCNPGSVANVSMTLTGSSGGLTLTDGSGNYSLPAGSGGSYTVTPTKADRVPGSSGINTLDVIAVQKHFLGSVIIPPGCRLTAANVAPPAVINTLDVIAIQHFFLGQTFGIANVGKYQFTPVNRSYSPLTSNQAAQNFSALIFGDVAGPFVNPPRPGGPDPDGNDE